MTRRRSTGGDLFGKKNWAASRYGSAADRLAHELRSLSESAYTLRLARAAALIEIAALIVELEGGRAHEAGGQS